MTTELKPVRFSFEITQDGSPTLRITEVQEGSAEISSSEAMHSLKGALSETAYIYGEAIKTALERGFAPRILSMGLGLGYVELLATAHFLKHQCLELAEMESFEIVPELRTWFTAWLHDSGDCPSDFRDAYDWISLHTATALGVDSAVLKASLLKLYQSGRWRLREALDGETRFSTRFGCICFDAFSSKSTPELWTEDFLSRFLNLTCDTNTVLSTYACTGALKRSLRAAGFGVTIREGFSSKRDSTFAVRINAM